jgi:hypothetical protein
MCEHGVTVCRHPYPKYACAWHASRGSSVCIGIGYRNEPEVDAALLECVAPLIEGDVADRALADLRERLDARARVGGRDAERERLQRVAADADRRAPNLAQAIAAGKAMAPLLEAMDAETKRAEATRAELARLETSVPATLDVHRVVADTRERLAELATLRRRGGVGARPVLAAVLGKEHFVATPVLVNGRRTWQLMAKVARGYLSNIVSLSNGISGRGCRGTALEGQDRARR